MHGTLLECFTSRQGAVFLLFVSSPDELSAGQPIQSPRLVFGSGHFCEHLDDMVVK